MASDPTDDRGMGDAAFLSAKARLDSAADRRRPPNCSHKKKIGDGSSETDFTVRSAFSGDGV